VRVQPIGRERERERKESRLSRASIWFPEKIKCLTVNYPKDIPRKKDIGLLESNLEEEVRLVINDAEGQTDRPLFVELRRDENGMTLRRTSNTDLRSITIDGYLM
jgi:hypothetical protein